jgi:4-hydroxyproline epimerase
MSERLERFRRHFDYFRSAVVNEPRGNDVIVGGLICKPHQPDCVAGIIFFNNHSYLGMCGHGLIGLIVTLHHLGQIPIGLHRIDTPVGVVTAELKSNSVVAIKNVPSFRYRSNVGLHVPEYGEVIGDIAWGGNWFFLVKNSAEVLRIERAIELTDITSRIRKQLERDGITGSGGAWIDHVELFGPAVEAVNHSRNFVLCPGGAYDRSPCGTGTSAKLACLAADRRLDPGEHWRQESIVGSLFIGSYELAADELKDARAGDWPTIIPAISGSAFVCAESTLLFHPADPFCIGLTK